MRLEGLPQAGWRHAFLGLLVLLTLAGCHRSPKGQQAPDFTLNLLETPAKTITLSQLFNEQPVLLVFWATWCPTCVEEIPVLNAWAAQYADQFRILAVNVSESPEQVAQFREKYPFVYPAALDEHGEVAERYELVGLPVSLFLAKGGEILYYGFGLPADIEQFLAGH